MNRLLYGICCMIFCVAAMYADINYPASTPQGDWWPLVLVGSFFLGLLLVVWWLSDFAVKKLEKWGQW